MFIDKKIYEIYPINPTYPDMLKKIPSAPKKIYCTLWKDYFGERT